MEYARAAHVRDDLSDSPDSPAERLSRRPRRDSPSLKEEEDNSLQHYWVEGVSTFYIQVSIVFQ
jgi:hypothetical protein